MPISRVAFIDYARENAVDADQSQQQGQPGKQAHQLQSKSPRASDTDTS